MSITGNQLFVKALKEEQVDVIFGYPGACVIDVFDELYKQQDIQMVLPRHEQGLIHAADGYARSTGRTGVCLVTSGPGATNLVTGIATANYDSVPLVCFTGQVARNMRGNDAFQEVDIVGITRSICKYAVSVNRREDLGRIIKEAFYIAKSGRPGPVVVDLPKDMMLELGTAEYPGEVHIRSYKPNGSAHSGQMKKAFDLLAASKKPVLLAGGGIRISGAEQKLTELAEKMNIPVVTTIMGKGCIDTGHPLYVGNLGMHGSYAANMAVQNCDLLLAIGTRFNDRITGKTGGFAPDAAVIHIDMDTASISKNVEVDIPVVADAGSACRELLKYNGRCDSEEWLKEILCWKKEHPLPAAKSGVTPVGILEALNEAEAGIFVTDVGQHQMWSSQYLELGERRRLYTSGGLGTMGYGFPAAIGAQIGNPDQQVFCISGDGGFQMNIQELATASAMELPIVICIFNNGYLGMVRQWQELFYDKRYSATCLQRRGGCEHNCTGPKKSCPTYLPDFIRLAESYGAKGIRVTEESQIREAIEEAGKNKKAPTVIEFIIDMEELVMPMVAGGKTLDQMIEAGGSK